ncbi:MAG: response regulator [Lachnospiraceae bacterium]
MDNEYSFEHGVTTKHFFNALRAHAVRLRMASTVVFLGLCDAEKCNIEAIPEAEKKVTDFLVNETRTSDLVVKFRGQTRWLIILSQTDKRSAAAFLRRLYMKVKNKGIPALEGHEILFSASVAEIGNDEGTFEELMAEGMLFLTKSLKKGPEQIEYIDTFKKRPLQKIRISILEDNAIFRNVLYRTLENLDLEYFEAEIKEFQDGYEFLQSNWYRSAHTHLIIMNDILPRQSGLDVLHKIRMLPNNRRFIIFMMTKRNSEEDMIYAYESGVDNFLVKPFNLHLLKVEIKRTFERLWS